MGCHGRVVEMPWIRRSFRTGNYPNDPGNPKLDIEVKFPTNLTKGNWMSISN